MYIGADIRVHHLVGISRVTYVVKAMATFAAITEPPPALMASARAVVQSEAIAFAVESSSPKCWRRPNEVLRLMPQ